MTSEDFKNQLEISSLALGTKVDQKFAKASLQLNLSMAKCLISQGMLIPTSQIQLAEENLRVRAIDLTWVNHLKTTMQFSPLASYTPWAVVTYTSQPFAAVLEHPERFEFTVIGEATIRFEPHKNLPKNSPTTLCGRQGCVGFITTPVKNLLLMYLFIFKNKKK